MVRSRRRFFVCAMASLVAVSCTDRQPTSLGQGSRSAAVLDAATGGNPHFYFLRPVATANPSPDGQFNPTLYPTLEICRGTQQAADGHCVDALAVFERPVTHDETQIHVPSGEELYKLIWKTSSYSIAAGEQLRLVVMLGDFMAGYADITKDNSGDFRDAGGAVIPGGSSSIPVKFRIENGVICGNRPLCAEQGMTPAGGTVTVDDGGYTIAGAEFPANTFTSPVNVTIEQLPAPCLPLPNSVSQYLGCFRFHTEPEITGDFAQDVVVGICLIDAAGAPYLNDGQLRLWKWSEEEGDPMLELERVTVDFLDCPPLQTSSIGGSGVTGALARAGSMLLSPVGRLLSPKMLYALGGYEGGKLSNFSRIGWVRPLKVVPVQGNNQSAPVGTTTPVAPKVRVVNKYSDHSTIAGIDGATVAFSPSSDGVATPESVETSDGGYASTNWQLATVAGPNTLVATAVNELWSAPAPDSAYFVFGATGYVTNLQVHWLSPLQQNAPALPATATMVNNAAPVLTFTESVSGSAISPAVSPVAYNIDKYQYNWSIPTTLDAARTYHIRVTVGGSVRSQLEMKVVNGVWMVGADRLNLSNSRNLPIKFLLHY